MSDNLNQQANEQAICELRSQVAEYSEHFIEPFVTAGSCRRLRSSSTTAS